GGLSLCEEGLDEFQAGVLDQADHPRGREDAREVRRPHVRGDRVGRLMGQTDAQPVAAGAHRPPPALAVALTVRAGGSIPSQAATRGATAVARTVPPEPFSTPAPSAR